MGQISIDNKPYNSLNGFYREKFGKKVIKLCINAGFSCPNRDGTLSFGGCIFCSEEGSGDFAGDIKKSIKEQMEEQISLLSNKWHDAGYIAYFQSFTNTYAPVSVLKEKYEEALSFEGVLGISIATRPDCINKEIVKLLKELNKKTYVCVELGFQTSNEETAKLINRGYKNNIYENAVTLLRENNIDVVTHVIIGLPYETHKDVYNTVNYVSSLDIQGLKFHLLHILKNTALEKLYKEKGFHIYTEEEYIEVLCRCVQMLPKNIVVHRLTGDGDRKKLVEPLWSLDKRKTLNNIHKYMKKNNILQGSLTK